MCNIRQIYVENIYLRMIADLNPNPATRAEVMGSEQSMAEQDLAPGVDLYQVAHIVSSYVGHHQIGPDQLGGLIVEVHRALAGVRQAAPPAPVPSVFGIIGQAAAAVATRFSFRLSALRG